MFAEEINVSTNQFVVMFMNFLSDMADDEEFDRIESEEIIAKLWTSQFLHVSKDEVMDIFIEFQEDHPETWEIFKENVLWY